MWRACAVLALAVTGLSLNVIGFCIMAKRDSAVEHLVEAKMSAVGLPRSVWGDSTSRCVVDSAEHGEVVAASVIPFCQLDAFDGSAGLRGNSWFQFPVPYQNLHGIWRNFFVQPSAHIWQECLRTVDVSRPTSHLNVGEGAAVVQEEQGRLGFDSSVFNSQSIGQTHEHPRPLVERDHSCITFGNFGRFLRSLGSFLSGPPHQPSNNGIDGQHTSNNYFYTKSFLIASILAFLSGFPFFTWGWGWWSGIYDYPKWSSTPIMATASCIVGVMLWASGTFGIMVWSMQF